MEGPVGRGERFELRGELGVGGSGTVYRVFDHGRGEEVALKTLRRSTGGDLYRFKREFRALAGVHHPNLVKLHELFAVGNEWMFTMELIDGERFDRWARPAGVLDEARLRDALRQLADALVALHATGKIHRDMKSTNVIVEPGGRLVVLDFGLAVTPETVDRTHEGGAVGTIAYMSPEQAADLPLGPPTDWYAVGVMLHEALTGERPLRGSLHDVLVRKQRNDEPPELPADAPADLAELCRQLMARDPARRPTGEAVLAALGAEPSPATRALVAELARGTPTTCDPVALDQLREAFAASRDHLVAVFVRGPHGSGKSALYRAFVEELRATSDAVVLAVVDTEREQTPMPAVDQAIDQLSAFLLGLPHREADDLAREAAPLARVFPALRRVPALRGPPLPGRASSPAEVFREGVDALRRLIARIAADRPLVFAVDNGRGPPPELAGPMVERFTAGGRADEPRVLLLMVLRPDAVPGNPLLAHFERWRDERGGDLRLVDLPGEVG